MAHLADLLRGALPTRPAAEHDAASAAGRHVQRTPVLWSLLAAAGLVDWIVTRTLTRLAIFLPKSAAMISAYEVLAWVGQVGTTLAALLALIGMAWVAGAEWRLARVPWLGFVFAGLTALSLFFLVRPPGSWLLLWHGLAVAALLGIMVRGRALPRTTRFALWLPTAAMLAASVHQAAPTLYTALGWAGPPRWGQPAFLVGEVLVLVAAGALWWAYGRGAARRRWGLAALPVALFAASYSTTPSMTATIVIWSNGLTLFLPWWLYAAALWLWGVAVVQQARAGERTIAAALVLLAAAGYAPQLSSQLFMGLVALWLLLGASRPNPQ